MTYLDELRGIRPDAAADEDGQSIVRERRDGTGPWAWIKKRNWIKPALDLTGGVSAKTEIRNRLAAARPGACMEIPDGIIRVGSNGSVLTDDIFVIPPGVTVTCAPRGQSYGHRVFNGQANNGTLFKVYDKGKLFKLSWGASFYNATVYYPEQNNNSAPNVYGYTFHCAGHSNNVANVTAINPYQFILCDAPGPNLEKISGQPLARGITLGRVGDVARLTDINFTQANLATSEGGATGATLNAWVQANATALLVDGPEEFCLSKFFAYGYNVGVYFLDEDADGFRGVYGSWSQGGLDLVNAGILVGEPNGLTIRAFKVSNVGLIPNGALANAILFVDTHVAASNDQRPAVMINNSSVWNTHSRLGYMTSGSYGHLAVTGLTVRGTQNGIFRNESTNATIEIDHLGADSDVTRTEQASSLCYIRDRAGCYLDKTTGSWDNGSRYYADRTTAISSTNVFGGNGIPPAGPYLLYYDLIVFTPESGGSHVVAVSCAFTDPGGARTGTNAGLVLNAAGAQHASFTLEADGVNPVTFSTAFTGAAGTGTPHYSLYIRCIPR